MNSLFIGYDTPESLDVKHQQVLPLLDTMFKRTEIDGDVVHILEGEIDLNFCEDMIVAFNTYYDTNLTLDITRYSEE